MRTREKSSIDWNSIRSGYRQNIASVRSLAREFAVSDTAIRKRARLEGWVRIPDIAGSREPSRRRLLGMQVDALARAFAVAAGSVSSEESDRYFVAAMVALKATAADIAGALKATEEVFLPGQSEAGRSN